MRIAISGKAGSGKSTVAKLLAEKLGLKHYSIGDLMRAMALENGMTLVELNAKAEKDKSIDLELDNKLKELGKRENNFIVDGRLTAFFIPNADARIFLEADDSIRAERVLKAGRQNEKTKNLQETIKSIEKREESERRRYRKYYDADYTDKKLYNCIIDTTKLTPREVVEKIIKFVEKRQ